MFVNKNEKITVESKITLINEFRQHLFRSLDIRTLVARDMIEGVNSLDNNISDDKGSRLLRRALKNEIPFFDSVNKGLVKTKDYLTEVSIWLKNKSSNEDILNHINKLISLLDVFNKYFAIKNDRLKKEEFFLNNPNGDSLRNFLLAWGEEVKSVRSLLIDSGNCSEIDSFFKEVGLGTMVALRSGFCTDNFNKKIMSWNISFKDNEEFMLYFSYISLLSSISLMFLTFRELEEKIETVNLETLKKLDVKF